MTKRGKKNYVMQTKSGVQYDVRKGIATSEIRLGDIAHGLSQVCRFSGQIWYFYSVAAHSLNVSKWIELHGGTPQECLEGLFHDASEAYIIDLPSPVKHLCAPYRRLEENFTRKICQRFGLRYPLSPIVWEADKALLELEKHTFYRSSMQKMPWANKYAGIAFADRALELAPRLFSMKGLGLGIKEVMP